MEKSLLNMHKMPIYLLWSIVLLFVPIYKLFVSNVCLVDLDKWLIPVFLVDCIYDHEYLPTKLVMILLFLD